jgi:hypothetical protein
MSFKGKEKREHKINTLKSEDNAIFQETLFHIVQPYSSYFVFKRKEDIYTGEEIMPFNQRHPTFRALMKLEFQDAALQFERK